MPCRVARAQVAVRWAVRGAVPGRLAVLLLGGLLAAPACKTTVDSLGYNDASGIVLHRMSGPSVYPNPFRDLLGRSDAEIAAKIDAAFAQVFHGDPLTQAIYFPDGADQAHILDTYHGDVRTEGIGLGMIIAVELDKRDEFDRLWRYAKANRQYAAGANRGYFSSFCDIEAGIIPCVDPFGYQQFTMALLLAHGRWGSPAPDGGATAPSDAGAGATGPIDYGADARALLHVMRHKEDDNGGVVEGVTNTFDPRTGLVFDVPNVSAARESRPAVQMPAYWELWAQATADPFWARAAGSARAYWRRAAHPVTGLMPVRAFFDGAPLPGWDIFQAEGYRTQLNLALDLAWLAGDPWEVVESDRLLAFFAGQGIDRYGRMFTLDGTVLDAARETSLIAMNAVTALGATTGDRAAFVNALWALDMPTGPARYYTALLQLLGLLLLGGQLRVY